MRSLFALAVGLTVCGFVDAQDAPTMTAKRKDVKPFEYKDAKIPFYAPKFGAKGPLTKMQLPLEPAESMKHFVHPTDFELKLFVAEPQIKRPICMNWDERGRLWIAESVDYPNSLRKTGEGNDRITICEDTDSDGVADKFTVFADKLSIPTSFVFAHGGIVVTQAPHTLFLRSTKGNDIADERQVLFTGWGAGDTHAGPSNLHHGFDGWIYGIVGYSGFNGTVGGEKHKFGQGFFRFKLQLQSPGTAVPGLSVSNLEFVRSTNNNSWGVGWSEEGLLFGSTANGNPSVFMPIPNRYYEKVRGMSASVLPTIAASNKFNPVTDKVRQVDWYGGFTAAAGHALYTARTYPKEYWNRTAFVTEPTGHLVATFVLDKKGTNFSARNSWNLLASDDEWSAPIMAEVGPDGCVWVIDWYNYIVQHNPTPPGFKTGKGNAYETDLRDKVHGRIYRLVPKAQGRPSLGFPELKTPDQLVAALKNDNMFWRKHAQRLLVERRKTDIIDDLLKLIEDRSVDAIGLNAGAVHALWVLDNLGVMRKNQKVWNSPAVRDAVKHPSAAVRRAALLTSPSAENSLDVMPLLRKESDAQVKLAALLHVIDSAPDDHRGFADIVAVHFANDDESDPIWTDALFMAANHLRYYLESHRTGNVPRTAKGLRRLALIAENHARHPDRAKEASQVLSGIGAVQPEVATAIFEGYEKGWPIGQKPVGDREYLNQILVTAIAKVSPAGKGAVIRLARKWDLTTFDDQLQGMVAAVEKTLLDAKQTDDARLEAFRQLVQLKPVDAKRAAQVLAMITPQSAPTFAEGLLDGLAEAPADTIGPALLKRLTSFTPRARSTALRIMLGRTETTRLYLDAVEKGEMTLSELPLDQKQALAAHPDAKIAARAKAILAKGGGLPNADRQKVVEEFLPLMKKAGNVELGKAVFKKHCAICHTHSGEGVKIGPDLSGVAVHSKEHLLIDILDPSRSVEGNYRVYTVETKKGQVRNGLLASETKTTIELFNAEGKKLVVERDDIETIAASNKSLMPEGFEKTVKTEELLDLLEFLTARGKFVPILLDKAATIASTQGMFYSKDAAVERLILPDWSPRIVKSVPFHFVDPGEKNRPNVIMLYSKNGPVAATMPKSVKLECNMPARTIHLLSGVSGWGYPSGKTKGVALIVRLHYADGKTEDHALRDGEHFADYIRKVEVPKSEFAFAMRSQQMRYLSVTPGRDGELTAIEFVKGPDPSAPIVLAVTVETK